MVEITRKKGSDFGIEGYNLPVHQPSSKGIEWKVGKTKRKNFAEEAALLTAKFPGPGDYKTSLKWGVTEKKIKPSDRDTYITQIFKLEKKFGFPSSATVSAYNFSIILILLQPSPRFTPLKALKQRELAFLVTLSIGLPQFMLLLKIKT
jgi:hypothetical protein